MSCMRRKALSLLLIFSLFVGIVGVVNVDTTYAASKKTHLKKKTVYLVVGKTAQQKLIDKKGKTIKSTKVKWKSLKTSVAKINKKGKITAVRAGKAKMTAKYQGKTYKFTVNVSGPSAPASTPPPAPAPDPDSLAPYINVEKDSVDVHVGEIAVIRATSNFGGYTGYSCHNGSCFDIISRDMSTNARGEHVEVVTIKGLKVGTADIEFNNNYSGYVSKTVTINVLPTGTPTQMVSQIIDGKGYTNGNGDKTIAFDVSDEISTYFVNHSDSVEFICIYQSDSLNSIVYMTMPLPSSTRCQVELQVGSLTYYATVTKSTFTKDTTLVFRDSDGKAPIDAIQNLVNSVFKLAISSWDLGLLYNTGIDLSDLGFTSYK